MCLGWKLKYKICRERICFSFAEIIKNSSNLNQDISYTTLPPPPCDLRHFSHFCIELLTTYQMLSQISCQTEEQPFKY